MKPICVKDQRFYRMKQGGFYFLEQMPRADPEPGPPALAGTAEPHRWQPYKLWAGDLWECPDCGHQLVSGVGRNPVGEHYQSDFADLVQVLGADQLHVNDC